MTKGNSTRITDELYAYMLAHNPPLDAVQRDKKRRGGRVGFVVVDAPGDVRTGVPMAENDVRAAIGELR